MTPEDFVKNVSYFPLKRFTVPPLSQDLLEAFLLKMETLEHLTVSQENPKFEELPHFINTTISQLLNLHTLTVNVPHKVCKTNNNSILEMAKTLANLRHLNTLHIICPSLESYTDAATGNGTAVGVVALGVLGGVVGGGAGFAGGLLTDGARWLSGKSYKHHLIFARELGKSRSLQEIIFFNVAHNHDKENITRAVKENGKKINVSFL